MSVLVFAEVSEGKFKKNALEVVSYGKKLAEQLGTQLTAFTINAETPSELASYGADKIVTITNNALSSFDAKAIATVASQIAQKENSKVIIVDSSANGAYLAPIIAGQLAAGFASNVVELPISMEPFVVKRKAFSNKAFQPY